MTPSCPQCGNQINEDFGVVTCSKCQSVLFVDMEGNVQVTESGGDVNLAEASSSEQNFGSALDYQNPSYDQSTETPEGFLDSTELQSDSSDPMDDPSEHLLENSNSPSGADYQGDQPDTNAADSEEPEYRNMEPDESLEEPAREAVKPITNVSQFANSDLGLGALTYSVTIENIDTKETRQLLQEILSDSRFHWDSKDFMRQVKMGKLRIENINSTKASVLVQKISELPVKVSWKQNAFN
jgi:hypothetical protein